MTHVYVCACVCVQIKLVAAPMFVMTAQSADRQEGIEAMESALAKMSDVIKSKGGDLVVKLKVRGPRRRALPAVAHTKCLCVCVCVCVCVSVCVCVCVCVREREREGGAKGQRVCTDTCTWLCAHVHPNAVRQALTPLSLSPSLSLCLSLWWGCCAGQPRAVSAEDDKEIQDMMAKAEQETAQVAGDEVEDEGL
jgi:hypothetical protein